MPRLLKILMKSLLWIFITLLSCLFIVTGISVVLYLQADDKQPDVDVDLNLYTLSVATDSLRICGDNSFFLNKYGYWEGKLKGESLDRGVAYGVMARDLLDFQESSFVNQIREMIPSEGYLHFLRAVLKIFNRDMASYISDDFRREIYGISLSCSHEYDIFGTPYERQLNYHSAHDVGHMMQDYMLVGCSSFATWGDMSENGQLIIGRNFDFWVGDDFARNKTILFISPESGYKYASVSWPGMTGVVSGMNEKGLTVTINAAKGAIPTSSALPISLLAKEILLYAKNIDEACEIASRNSLFVSESLLIGSLEDGRAAIIEKTPNDISIFDPRGSHVICTNHFQSSYYDDDPYNIRNIEKSDSKYRFDRMTELLASNIPMNQYKAATVLRDRSGLGGKDIGLTNEMSINQSIGHHSVIFIPESMKMWVTTSPWQAGEMICYNLNDVFSSDGPAKGSFYSPELTIPADVDYINNIYPRILEYRSAAKEIRKAIREGSTLACEFIDEFVLNNSEYYDTFLLVGEYYEKDGKIEEALKYWKEAITKEFPYPDVKTDLELNKIKKYDKE